MARVLLEILRHILEYLSNDKFALIACGLASHLLRDISRVILFSAVEVSLPRRTLGSKQNACLVLIDTAERFALFVKQPVFLLVRELTLGLHTIYHDAPALVWDTLNSSTSARLRRLTIYGNHTTLREEDGSRRQRCPVSHFASGSYASLQELDVRHISFKSVAQFCDFIGLFPALNKLQLHNIDAEALDIAPAAILRRQIEQVVLGDPTIAAQDFFRALLRSIPGVFFNILVHQSAYLEVAKSYSPEVEFYDDLLAQGANIDASFELTTSKRLFEDYATVIQIPGIRNIEIEINSIHGSARIPTFLDWVTTFPPRRIDRLTLHVEIEFPEDEDLANWQHIAEILASCEVPHICFNARVSYARDSRMDVAELPIYRQLCTIAAIPGVHGSVDLVLED